MKKVFGFLLCLMIVFTALPLAMAETSSSLVETVSTVTFTLTLPKPGTTADGYPEVTVPARSPYHAVTNRSAWLVKRSTASYYQMSSTTVFEAGKTYYAGIIIAADNCEFAADTKQVCTNASIVSPYVDDSLAFVAPIVEFTVPQDSDPDPSSAPAGDTEKVTLKKLKSVKLKALSAKKIQVTWKKLSKKDQKKIQKIQIQYSTDKSFKTYKTKWAKKTKNTYTIKGLKKNTKYYIRIRAYKKSGNITYVSKWVTKNKKTKKK